MQLTQAIRELQTDLVQGQELDLDKIHRLIRQISITPEFQDDDFLKMMISFLNDDALVASSSDYNEDNTTSINDSLLKLFEVLSENYRFETFDTRIMSLKELIPYIEKTNNSKIFEVLCKLVNKVRPSDIVANTDLIKVLIQKLNSDSVSIAVVSQVENVIQGLNDTGGILIRRRLLSKEVISILQEMRDSQNIEKISRVLDLVKMVYLSFVKNGHELPTSFFQFDLKTEIQSDDIMYPMTILSYYNGILEYAHRYSFAPKDLKWVLDLINITEFVNIYLGPDVGSETNDMGFDKGDDSFLCDELIRLLAQISRYRYKDTKAEKVIHHVLLSAVNTFREQNSDDIRAKKILSCLNPKVYNIPDIRAKAYFMDFFDNHLKMNHKNLPIIQNTIGDYIVYVNCIEPDMLTSDKIIHDIGPMDQILSLLETMVQYEWSAQHLTSRLPSVMNLLLDTQMTNPELVELKRGILVRLLQYKNNIPTNTTNHNDTSDEDDDDDDDGFEVDISIWENRILDELGLLHGFKLRHHDPNVAVADETV